MKAFNPKVFYEAIKECVERRKATEKGELVVVLPEWVALVLIEYAKGRKGIGVRVKIDDETWPFAVKSMSEVQ